MSHLNGNSGPHRLVSSGDVEGVQRYLAGNTALDTCIEPETGCSLFHVASGVTDPLLFSRVAQIIRLLAARWPAGLNVVCLTRKGIDIFVFFLSFFHFLFFQQLVKKSLTKVRGIQYIAQHTLGTWRPWRR